VSRRQRCTPAEVETALDALDRDPTVVAASSWPGSLDTLDEPGLYSWWADEEGVGQLSSALGIPVPAGRIYAGQTGATKWPSGKLGAMTLRQRIGGNHLRGTIYGSTFRQTLAACLRQPLELQPAAPGRLTRDAEQALSSWMRQHLHVAVHPFPERDALGDLEDEVLARLDPPLNLDGMPATPIRARLTVLRGELTPLASSPVKPVVDSGKASAPRHGGPSSVGTPSSDRGQQITLHQEIAAILREAGNRWMTTTEIAEQVNARGQYRRRDGGPVTPFQVHGRTRQYRRLFARDGARVRLIAPV